MSERAMEIVVAVVMILVVIGLATMFIIAFKFFGVM